MRYRVYENSAKATVVNGLLKVVALIPFLVSVMLSNDEAYTWVLVCVLFVVMIVANVFINKLTDKMALEGTVEVQVKKAKLTDGLLYTKMNENNELVLDMENEILTTPATIKLTRRNFFGGALAGCKYIINDEAVVKLRNNQSINITTSRAFNKITLKNTQGDFNDPYLVKFMVRDGEQIELFYQFNVFKGFARSIANR